MKTTTASTYRGYPVNTGKENNLPVNITTMDQIIDRVEHMTEKHSKVLAVRLDIRADADSAKDLRQLMPRIIEETKRKLESTHSKNPDNRNNVDMHYVWAAEQSSRTRHEHAHTFVLVNANAVQNSYSIFDAMKEAVCKYLNTYNQGLVELCPSTRPKGLMINRNAPDYQTQKDKAVEIGSYLAKTRSKENKPKNARFSSASILRK